MTYKDLTKFITDLKNNIGTQETKVQMKLYRIFDLVKPYFEEYRKLAEELRIDHCAVNDKGVLLKDEKGNYQFTKDSQKALIKDLEKLDNEEFTYSQIQINKPEGLHNLIFLKGWVTGVEFEELEEI